MAARRIQPLDGGRHRPATLQDGDQRDWQVSVLGDGQEALRLAIGLIGVVSGSHHFIQVLA